MKKFLSVALVVIMLLCLVPTMPVFAAKENFLVLNEVTVSGVKAPIVGEKPSLTATSDQAGKYTVAKVSWSEYDKDFEHVKDMGANDTFREGYYYFVFINLEAKSSYTFSKNMTQSINGKSANKYTPSDGNKKVQIYTHFSSTMVVKKVELNVVMPVIGKTPTFAKVDTAQYYSANAEGVKNMTNGVYWRNLMTGINLTVNNPFKADGKYYVCYCLVPKEGYAFDASTEFFINGRKAVISTAKTTDGKDGMTALITNIVPTDGKKEIATLDLSVTTPKDGEKPDYTKIDGTGYFSDNGINGTSTRIYKNGIAWYKSASSVISPGTTETFKGGTEYTVKIAITLKDGYKFSKSLTAKINGKTATVETFDDGSINVSAKLTALNKDHKHTDSDWKTDKDNHWKICTDASCGMITVEKEAHKDTNKDNKCDTCGYAIPKEEKPVENTPSDKTPTTDKPDDKTPNTSTPVIQNPTTSAPDSSEPADTTPPESTDDDVVEDTAKDNGNTTENDDKNKEESSSAWIWIVIVAVVVLGAVAAVLVIVKKKKK